MLYTDQKIPKDCMNCELKTDGLCVPLWDHHEWDAGKKHELCPVRPLEEHDKDIREKYFKQGYEQGKRDFDSKATSEEHDKIVEHRVAEQIVREILHDIYCELVSTYVDADDNAHTPLLKERYDGKVSGIVNARAWVLKVADEYGIEVPEQYRQF